MKFIFNKSLIIVSLALVAFFMLTSSQKHTRGGGGTIVDRLYEEVLDENAELKKLDDDWEKVRKEGVEKKNQLQSKLTEIENYYREATRVSGSITDAELKAKATKMVTDAEANYKKLAEPIRQQITELEKMVRLMADHVTLLKIKYTLPKVKTMEGQLSTDELKAVIKNYGDLVRRAGKMGE